MDFLQREPGLRLHQMLVQSFNMCSYVSIVPAGHVGLPFVVKFKLTSVLNLFCWKINQNLVFIPFVLSSLYTIVYSLDYTEQQRKVKSQTIWQTYRKRYIQHWVFVLRIKPLYSLFNIWTIHCSINLYFCQSCLYHFGVNNINSCWHKLENRTLKMGLFYKS